jgi:hypothetical protein
LPSYTKARVHLAEIYSSSDRASDAEALLIPAISSGDPEVRWRLADVLASQKRYAEAEVHMQAASLGSRLFLNGTCSHLQITVPSSMPEAAIMGAERSILARVNVANRPTLAAPSSRPHEIAVSAGDIEVCISNPRRLPRMRWEAPLEVFGSFVSREAPLSQKREGTAA